MTSNTAKRLINPLNAIGAVVVIIMAKTALSVNGTDSGRVLNLLQMIPAAVLAHSAGIMLVCAVGIVAALTDTLLIPVFFGNGSLAAATRLHVAGWQMLELFLLMLIPGIIVSVIAAKWKQSYAQESQRAEEYLKKMYLQRKRNDCALHDAESHVRRCREDIDRYSSLVLLLEEAAERIYSNLDIEVLLDSFVLVLQKCLGARSGSIYFLDDTGEAYTLHRCFGCLPAEQPDPVPVNDSLVEYATLSHRAINLTQKEAADPQLSKTASESRLRPAMMTMLLEGERAAGIVSIHDFTTNANRDETRETALLSMVGNIMSIALTNARLFMKIQDMALKDPLTQLYNRRYFYEQLSKQIEQCRRERKPCCVLLCDIDHFKRVNDNHGHSAGDTVLMSFARQCSTTIREYDVLARYGGEEFIFLLPGMSADEGRRAAERVRELIAGSTFHHEGTALQVTTSCGVAAFPESAQGIDDLIERADEALYEAKKQGRNIVAVAPAQHQTYEEESQTIG